MLPTHLVVHHFNSTKVQFGDHDASVIRPIFDISIPLRYNLEAQAHGYGRFADHISIPLRYNLETRAKDNDKAN